MTILEIQIRPQSAEYRLDNNNGRLGGMATASFRVKTDDASYMPKTLHTDAAAFTGGPYEIPAQLDTYLIRKWNGASWDTIESNNNLYARDFHVRKDPAEPLQTWLIDVTWKPLDPGTTPSDLTDSPLDRPTRYWLEFQETTRNVDNAYNVDAFNDPSNGVAWREPLTYGPVTNTAGFDYDEPLLESEANVVICAEKTFATLDQMTSLHSTYDGTTNANEWLGVKEWRARYESITCNPVESENGVEFYRGVVRVKVARKRYIREIVNRGWQYYDDVLGIDVKQWGGTEPVLLTSDGKKLADGTLGNTVRYLTLDPVDYSGII